jgi:hypothetical protein
MTTITTTSHSRTQSVEEAAYYYGALDGLMLNDNTMDSFSSSHPAPVSVDEKEAEEEEMMTTALLLDGALGDMVAVSTPRTGLDAAGEGVWRTFTRTNSHHHHHDLNLWWSVDADCVNKATLPLEDEEEVEVSRRLLVTPPPPPLVVSSEEKRDASSYSSSPPSSPAVTIGVEEEEEEGEVVVLPLLLLALAIIRAAEDEKEEEEKEAAAPAAKRIRLFAY